MLLGRTHPITYHELTQVYLVCYVVWYVYYTHKKRKGVYAVIHTIVRDVPVR